jgi:1,4-alpha-glucan branching enzyme
MAKGSFVLFLHSHLPWVLNHGKWPHGSSWLMEAAAECYLPLLDVFNRLQADGIQAKATVGITPVLAEMLGHSTFAAEFEEYCLARAKAADEDVETFRRTGYPKMERLARITGDHYREILERFRGPYRRDLLSAFKKLQDSGAIEIITCCATHGYMPLLGRDECVNAQVALGQAAYTRRFGRPARGIWMPECAYRPAYAWKRPVGPGSEADPAPRRGVDELLHDRDIRFTIVDTHLLKGGEASGVYKDRFAILKELYPGDSGSSPIPAGPPGKALSPQDAHFMSSNKEKDSAVAFFTRDADTSLQVWSGEHGYPGDGVYRDFHKKAFPSGHQYWRVTNPKADLGSKELYEPDVIAGRTRTHAEHFVNVVSRTLADHLAKTGTPGVVAAPFDTELFGHWWFEGPQFLEQVYRVMAKSDVTPATGSEYLTASPPEVVLRLPEGSWGEGGHHWVWLNPRNEWTWRKIYEAEDKVVGLIQKVGASVPPKLEPYLKQLARELLLLESSDWQFLITTVAAADYSEMRFARHFEDLERLHVICARMLDGTEPDAAEQEWFREVAKRDSLFEEIDLGWWRATGVAKK